MSAFAKIAQATATGGGNNIRDGIYKFLIEKVVYQQGHSGDVFIAEFRVIEATSSGALDAAGKPVAPNTVGSSCSMVCNLTKHESAAGNAKAFVQGAMAGLGFSPEQITEQLIMEISGVGNPLRGLAVIDETYRGVNKGKSNPANRGMALTLNKWKAIAQTTDDVKAQRTWLDTNTAKADVGAPATPSAPTVEASAPAPVQAAAPAPAPVAPAPAPTPAGSSVLAGLGLK